MLATFANIDPRIITLLLTNPGQIPGIIEPAIIATSAKVIFLTITGVYILFSLIVFVQIRRLETWLLYLKRYHFTTLMIVQLSIAIVGWAAAFFLL